jgi:hypothetical protein
MRVQSQVLALGGFVASTTRGAVGLAFCLLAFSSAAFGQSVWNGNTGFWNNAGNWIGGVPTSSSLALIDDGNTAVASSVTVNTTNAQALGLFLDSGDTLTLTGFPDTQANLTVTAATLSGTMNIGAGASFTVNSLANQLGGTVSLSTAQLGGGLAPLMGQINGAGTYDNQAGTITGAGQINVPLSNEGTITATGNLFLNGDISNSGMMGAASGGNLIINGKLTTSGDSTSITVASGGTLTMNGNADSFLPVNLYVNDGGTLVASGTIGGGVFVDKEGVALLKGGELIGGGGSILNSGVIEGAGVIESVTGAADSLISANTKSGFLVVSDLAGTSTLEALNGGTLALHGTISAILVQADVGGTVSAQNAAIDSPTVTNSGTFAVLNSVGITGDYSQINGATLDMLLGTSSFSSQMNVDGKVSFGAGSILDVLLEDSSFFNPEAGCTNVFGVCDSWDVLRVTDGKIIDGGNLLFDLPSLPDGLTWSEIETPNDITLDIDGVLPATGGGGGSGTTTPEPESLLLLASGLAGLGCLAWRKRQDGVAV